MSVTLVRNLLVIGRIFSGRFLCPTVPVCVYFRFSNSDSRIMIIFNTIPPPHCRSLGGRIGYGALFSKEWEVQVRLLAEAIFSATFISLSTVSGIEKVSNISLYLTMRNDV